MQNTIRNNSTQGVYRWVIRLAIPIALQNIITYSVGLADNLMVGSLGELALSGAYVANQLQGLLHMAVIGLGAAMTILITQYWGKEDKESVKSIMSIALKASLVAGIILLVATLLFPNEILRLFTDEEAVIPEAFSYLKVIRFSYIFFCLTQILISSMRCIERVKIGLYVSLLAFFTNVFLNWVLIFGKLGAPALGVEGAAIATLISRMVEFVVILVYVRFVENKLNFRFQDLIKTNMVLLKDFFQYGFPVIAGDILWGINLAVQGAIVGRLGSTALASVSISNTVFQIVSVGVYGVAGASSIVIGQTVGSGNYDTVKSYAKKLQILFLIIGVISALVMFASKGFILRLYNISDDTLAMASQFITVLSIMLVGTSYQMSVLTGIVRAGGSIYFVLINDLLHVWLIVIPSALIAAFVFHAPPVVVF
ncbi:MAG: MATE family efflux transporter, partial [Clostridiales bacterium]|nr:MATE family efflux transporter [Clostridiales bacterium]